ncbi:LGFP repeat-containing protein [Nocardia farcinica]|uniref:LGFP repeat-containing protein n=1 Tax=Nocardia farcinica TaxID=37329 RepID=UPI0024563F46|nr:hypothetical protein [Nocardia farcinica]
MRYATLSNDRDHHRQRNTWLRNLIMALVAGLVVMTLVNGTQAANAQPPTDSSSTETATPTTQSAPPSATPPPTSTSTTSTKALPTTPIPTAKTSPAAPPTSGPCPNGAAPEGHKIKRDKWEPTKNPNRTVVPGRMRSDCEEVPGGFTKEQADKAETMEAALTDRAIMFAAPGCQVYWPAPYEVCGAIRDKYNELGGPNSFLLWPTTNELTNPDGVGKRSVFMNGPIYWSPWGGAHPVVNHFFAAWQRNGWEAGVLGYPTSDEIVNPDLGRRQNFQGGTIYWKINEAYYVTGAIQAKWNELGAEQGWLGYPITDELANGDIRYNRFQNGYIFWSPQSGAFPVRTAAGLRHPANDGFCSIHETFDCMPDNDIYFYMQACMEGLMKDDDIVLGLQPVTNNATFPVLYLTCNSYRHIHNGHNAHADQDRFAMCLALTYNLGGPWSGANAPNLGISWHNTNSDRWGYIVYSLTGTIVTAYPSGGDGMDWGGCTRGYLDD